MFIITEVIILFIKYNPKGVIQKYTNPAIPHDINIKLYLSIN